ncbi:hypothetical protein KIW84_043381 [Lathyrus oleraceus]|uniref:Uncharacterized protein n=1 Tax=Pisum sativum TaxID=3888 RepID=A0A9D5ARR2_PEA|nr:hypothetical protein KIW84_043381 [Pisum sativum]
MIDVQAREMSEKDLQAGLRLAHPEAVKYIEPQIRFAVKAGKSKKEYRLYMLSDKTLEKKVLEEEEEDEESIKVLSKTVDTVRKKVVRKRIISEGSKVDRRQLDEVRPLYCEAGYVSMLHGSAFFSRGETQVLCTVTLGARTNAQRLDSLVGPPLKRFMLHYSFPPFCINEVGKHGTSFLILIDLFPHLASISQCDRLRGFS